MLKQFIQTVRKTTSSNEDAYSYRQRFNTLYNKLNENLESFQMDNKLNFKIVKKQESQTFYLGAYVIRFEFDDISSIQLYRRADVDLLQYCELLAISFENHLEFITDEMFVKADIYQIEILVNHVINKCSSLTSF